MNFVANEIRDSTNIRVLFFMPYGAWRPHNIFDLILSAGLRVRGAECAAVTCDGLYQDRCYVLAHSSDQAASCAQCQRDGLLYFQAFAFPPLQLRAYVRDDEVRMINEFTQSYGEDNFLEAEFQGLPIGRWTASAVCSYYRVSPNRLDDPDARDLHRKYCNYAYFTYRALERLIDEMKPSHMVILNGNGFVHGAAYEVATHKGLKVLTHEVGWTADTYFLVENQKTGSLIPHRTITANWEKVSLTKEQLSTVKKGIYDREGGGGATRQFYNFSTDNNHVKELLNIPAEAKICAFFTSSEYEMLYYNKEELAGMPSQLAVLESVIKIFRSRPEFLVIRHHPLIGGIVNNTAGRADYHLMTKLYQIAQLAPPNVRVIMPHERLTSYALMWNADVSITPFSTTSFESVLRGVPVAVLDKSTYVKAATLTIKSADETEIQNVVEELFESQRRFSIDDLRKAYRTMHSIQFRMCHLLSSFDNGVNSEFKIKIKSFEELAPGQDPTLDHICNHFFLGTSIYPKPPQSELQRPTDEEDQFLREELAELNAKRSAVKASAQPVSYDTFDSIDLVRLQIPGRAEMPSSFDAWYKRSRHKAKNIIVNSDAASLSQCLTSTLMLLQDLNSELVCLVNDTFYYDEAFITSSVGDLAANSECQGLLWGIWVTNNRRLICNCLFTDRNPCNTYDAYLSSAVYSAAPWAMLSLGVFRRKFLCDLIQKALAAVSGDAALRAIHHALCNVPVKTTGRAMLIDKAPLDA